MLVQNFHVFEMQAVFFSLFPSFSFFFLPFFSLPPSLSLSLLISLFLSFSFKIMCLKFTISHCSHQRLVLGGFRHRKLFLKDPLTVFLSLPSASPLF